jgi:hypothetical protein
MLFLDLNINRIPSVFRYLLNAQLIREENVLFTKDGFYMIYKSISSILISKGIETFPDREDRILECRNFFDDWFLFGIPDHEDYVYGLLKMREQEHDLEQGMKADGDTPGVTISFISFSADILKSCLENPSAENRKEMGMEINRVVAYPKQSHHPALKAYFIRPQAEAPYLIAETYVNHIASFSIAGRLNVPKAYKEIYLKRSASVKYARVPDFLDQNNREANRIVCDHEKIYIQNVNQLSLHEKLAILATHTGNVSNHSFAAEIRYHAMFLTKLMKIRLPLAGSPYASAVRADMSIGDKEFQGPTPYYDLSGKIVCEQVKYHTDVYWLLR